MVLPRYGWLQHPYHGKTILKLRPMPANQWLNMKGFFDEWHDKIDIARISFNLGHPALWVKKYTTEARHLVLPSALSSSNYQTSTILI
jgi:hypothetical protein